MSTPCVFGRFEIRTGQRDLLIDGEPTEIGARAFDVLVALWERRDRTVAKSELLDIVWPGLVVEENNLQVQISTIRKLLGPKAVATVPGIGYRFTLAADPLKQRLAAILAADAVGYSRLMAADERTTVAALEAARAVFRRHVKAHLGRVIDMAGDSVLAVFETAIGAVLAAQAVQRDVSAHGEAAEDRQLHFRIGLHLGDIFEKDDGTVYGDGINVAARLQSLAEPGGITASDAIESAVRGRLAARFVDQGEYHAKNIPHPLHAFAVHLGDDAVAPATASAPTLRPPTDRPSIAVLPFTNMSGDPEQDYFADGMVEEITTALARMGWVFVIARNSSFVYKGKAVDIKQVGRELGASYILEGSVRKAGNRLRITGQLIEAESGHHVWAERFESTLEDVFDLQDRIAESIVSAVEPNVRRTEIERARVKPTSNLQAYDLMLRALPNLMPGVSRAGRDQALSFIRRALEKDPHYSLAKALGAFACMERMLDGTGSADDVKMGLQYAEEALAERSDDPAVLSYAGSTLGTLGYRKLGFRVLGFRYDQAERAIDRALTLSPNLLLVQFCAGSVRTILGDGDRALEHFERAMRISPRDPGSPGFIASVGGAHLVAGRYEHALASVERAIQDTPNFVFSHVVRLSALGRLGRHAEARQAAQRLLELSPEFTVSRYKSLSPIRDPEFRRQSEEIFRAAGIPK